MLASHRVNKENQKATGLKKGSSYNEEDVFKGREFGTELTNNTDTSSDCAADEKSPCITQEVAYESNLPKTSPKTHKLSDHYSGPSISQR